MFASVTSTGFRTQGIAGIRRQQVHIILMVTIALGGAGRIRDLSNGLDILPGGIPPLR